MATVSWASWRAWLRLSRMSAPGQRLYGRHRSRTRVRGQVRGTALPVGAQHLAAAAGEGGRKRLLADRARDETGRAVRQRHHEPPRKVAAETLLRLRGIVLQVVRPGPDNGLVVTGLDQQDGVRRAVGKIRGHARPL